MGTLLAILLLQTQAEIESAVRKGLEVVKTAGADELALWTLVRCEVPENNAAVRALLDGMLQGPPASTIPVSLQAMILELLDRHKYRDRIGHCAQLLIDTQCRDGRWGPGHPVDPPDLPALPPLPRLAALDAPKPVLQKIKLKARGQGGEKGDSVLSRWALWGLLAGHHAGLIPPAELVEKAAAAWRTGAHDAADVVSALSICLYLSGRDWKKDKDVLKAVERLGTEKRSEPRALYGLERAMIHFDSATLGGVEWYPRDAKILLAAQKPDGSWGSLEDTCTATLALYKTRYLFQPPRPK